VNSAARSSTILGGLDRPRVRALALFLCVAAAYFGSAKVGLELSVAHGVITPVWPPTAISLVALVMFGPRLWPAVAAGAFLSNATSGVSLTVAAAIAVGNTLEAVVGAGLLRRAGFRPSLERTRDVLALAILGAFVSTTLAATNGVTTLAIADSPAASPYGSAWVLWWLGDAMGDLLLAPMLFVLASRPLRLPRRRLVEGVVLATLLAGTSAVVFLGGLWRYPYVVFPLLVWATLRFKQLGAATGSFVVAAFGVAGVVAGQTPLGDTDPTTEVQILQALLAFMAVSLLVLGATLAERDEAEQSLATAHANLAEAQRLAHVGSWEWEIGPDSVTWSDELFRIYGVEPRGTPLSYEEFLRRIHPKDRDSIRDAVGAALRELRSFETKHRIVLDDGTERTVQGRGSVVLDADGKAVRMVGTSQDVTERQLLEEVRENILVAVSHELRTPLTAIVGFASTLNDRGNDLSADMRREMIDHLAQQAHKLQRLLSDLLDLDRLRRGRARAAVEPTDVSSLVAHVIASQARDGHHIELDLAPAVADVDPAKVERIVENLVANALRHTPAGTPVSVGVTQGHDGVLITVDDGGSGVPDAEKDEIFQLFARGANADQSAPGTGVGLALVAQFTALQGGRAWVEDNPGGGASFRVLLPASADGVATGRASSSAPT
jgi:signal transduction histidine kinase